MTDNTSRPSTHAPSEGDEGLRPSYLEQMRAHCDEGGTLSHRNGLDLLAEVERLNALRRPSHTQGAEAMREALEPFASLGLPHVERSYSLRTLNVPFWDCPEDHVLYRDSMEGSITVGDVRRAYTAFHAVPASADGWQPIDGVPSEPCQVEFYFGDMVMLDQRGDPVVLPPWRDEKRDLGYWDGEHWHHCGTGHRVFEFQDTPKEHLPTHWRPLPSPPAPKETGP